MDVFSQVAVCLAAYILRRYHESQRAADLCGCRSCRSDLERWEAWGAADWEREPVAEPVEADSDSTPFWR